MSDPVAKHLEDEHLSPMAKAYTGHCTIDGKTVLMSSYNISVSTNVIKSQAAMPFFSNRMAGYALRDYPVYTLSIEIQPDFSMFEYLLKKLFKTKQGFSVNLVFSDAANGLTHSFSYAYLNGLECTVPNNEVCSMSLSFVYFGSSFQIKYTSHSNKNFNIASGYNHVPETLQKIVGPVLMPYYAFGVIYDNYPVKDLYELSFSFNQDITPKFFCYGAESSQGNAAPPSAVVWGLPTLTYNVQYIMGANSTDVNDYTRVKSHKIVVGKNDGTDAPEAVPLTIKYKGEERIIFGTCYPDTYGPSVGNMGDVNKYTLTGSVYGNVTYKESLD